MPTEYKLKRPVMDLNRLKKLAKSCISDGEEDRKLALETLDFFRNLVNEDGGDDVAKKCMTDCIKLAQTAKINITKIIDLIIKIEDLEYKKNNVQQVSRDTVSNVNFFSELSNEDR